MGVADSAGIKTTPQQTEFKYTGLTIDEIRKQNQTQTPVPTQSMKYGVTMVPQAQTISNTETKNVSFNIDNLQVVANNANDFVSSLSKQYGANVDGLNAFQFSSIGNNTVLEGQ